MLESGDNFVLVEVMIVEMAVVVVVVMAGIVEADQVGKKVKTNQNNLRLKTPRHLKKLI